MTKENSKKLYEHYVEIGYKKAAENMLIKYPEFKKKVIAETQEQKKKREEANK